MTPRSYLFIIWMLCNSFVNYLSITLALVLRDFVGKVMSIFLTVTIHTVG